MNGCIKNVLSIFLLFFLGSSCATKKKEEPVIVDYKSEMIEADRNFSKMSESQGIRYAMLQYIDNKGILLRPNAVPLVGGEAINFISQGNDSSYTMTWEPSGGTIALSGELGYTYGIYSLKPKTRDTVYYGTYVSIWKRQPDGKWKFSLETGNQGIE